MSLTPDPTPPADARASVPRLVLRTALLLLSLALLFPNVLAGIADGAWPRWLATLGTWRWVAWGGCFVAMMAVRFSGGPKRGS